MDLETKSAPILSAGSELAGAWRVERVLEPVQGVESALCVSDSGARAICTPLPARLGPAPLDESESRHWGTLRRVLPDMIHERVVVDEIPDGELLADLLEAGRRLPQGLREQISARVRDGHKEGYVHGALTNDRIVLSQEGVVMAGWALAQDDPAAARARDGAALAALTALPLRESAAAASEADEDEETSAEPAAPESSSPSPAGLHAAIAADHIPTLRAALEAWISAGGRDDDPEARRAADALGRLEARAREQVERARALLAEGDTLGVVAACREAIRIGEQDEAEGLIAEARRSTRRQLAGARLPSRRVLLVGAIGAAALALLALAAFLSLRGDPADEALRRRVERIATQQGPREGLRHLVGLYDAGDRREVVTTLLEASLVDLAEGERARLMDLRRRVVSEGARPREADVVAESGLGELDQLAAGGAEESALAVRVQSALAEIDRAASLYRAGSRIEVEDAESAVEAMLTLDPVFSTGAAGEDIR